VRREAKQIKNYTFDPQSVIVLVGGTTVVQEIEGVPGFVLDGFAEESNIKIQMCQKINFKNRINFFGTIVKTIGFVTFVLTSISCSNEILKEFQKRDKCGFSVVFNIKKETNTLISCVVYDINCNEINKNQKWKMSLSSLKEGNNV
jgi:hypothetical protein